MPRIVCVGISCGDLLGESMRKGLRSFPGNEHRDGTWKGGGSFNRVEGILKEAVGPMKLQLL